MVRFSRVGLRYPESDGYWTLSEVSFALTPGSFTWLLGPSGAGKSSLLGLISLSLRATEGEVEVLDSRIRRLPRRAFPALRRRIGVVFQDYRLLPHLSVYENAALPLRIQGLTEARLAADVREILRWVGLLDRAEAPPSTLSGGEQQRLALARAVVARPALLVADEPTGNLDAAQARRVISLLREMHRMGTTVIVATHSEELPQEYPAPTLRLEAGRLVSHG
ncbi:ATP-binding cassette domain-containing protein [Roseococcus sp. SDR]|uniref:cell division ATP-binding protein FtsE n=1 Tax=Roseococcus sp. SDR TaxID=2835532 RepID=UPI001BCD3389|nr:ATP-binding cassette domain-containing protein [Roseococcus sp. SDR]MBS7791052.1 ATP-binding cassette domain-containing protein [Roseococcus sp. SDR]MBV1846366.1 ATP-binding cassette domain-containing protein [Roseococcus sp. SDR]